MCQVLIQALGIEEGTKQTEIIALRSNRVSRVGEGGYEKNILPLKNYKLSRDFGLDPGGMEKQQRP